jgi:hypothetical protein
MDQNVDKMVDIEQNVEKQWMDQYEKQWMGEMDQYAEKQWMGDMDQYAEKQWMEGDECVEWIKHNAITERWFPLDVQLQVRIRYLYRLKKSILNAFDKHHIPQRHVTHSHGCGWSHNQHSSPCFQVCYPFIVYYVLKHRFKTQLQHYNPQHSRFQTRHFQHQSVSEYDRKCLKQFLNEVESKWAKTIELWAYYNAITEKLLVVKKCASPLYDFIKGIRTLENPIEYMKNNPQWTYNISIGWLAKKIHLPNDVWNLISLYLVNYVYKQRKLINYACGKKNIHIYPFRPTCKQVDEEFGLSGYPKKLLLGVHH